MKLRIIESAKEDLIGGHSFYEEQSPGLGAYFLDSLFSDIDSLIIYAGIHRKVFGLHRALSKRFPFAIYYELSGDEIRVHAVSTAGGGRHGGRGADSSLTDIRLHFDRVPVSCAPISTSSGSSSTTASSNPTAPAPARTAVFGAQARFDLTRGFPAAHDEEAAPASRSSTNCSGSCAATRTCATCTSTA